MRSIRRWRERVAVRRQPPSAVFSSHPGHPVTVEHNLPAGPRAVGSASASNLHASFLTGGTSRQQLAVTLDRADGTIRDVTAQCRFVANPARVASVIQAVWSAGRRRADRAPCDLSEPDGRGRRARRARLVVASGELSDRRRSPALQGWLQHGGLPRQSQWQGRIPAQFAGRRASLRFSSLDPRPVRPAFEPDRARAELDRPQADRYDRTRRRQCGSAAIRSRPRHCCAGSAREPATTERPRPGSSRSGFSLPSGLRRPAHSTSSLSSPPSLTMARPAT